MSNLLPTNSTRWEALRSIILDFWQLGVGSKPEELAPQTSHRVWHQEEPCRYREALPLCSTLDYFAVANGRERDNLTVEVVN
jgi:hypothetical protein